MLTQYQCLKVTQYHILFMTKIKMLIKTDNNLRKKSAGKIVSNVIYNNWFKLY